MPSTPRPSSRTRLQILEDGIVARLRDNSAPARASGGGRGAYDAPELVGTVPVVVDDVVYDGHIFIWGESVWGDPAAFWGAVIVE